MKYEVRVEFSFVESFEVEANSFEEAEEKGRTLADNLTEIPEGVEFYTRVVEVGDENGNWEEGAN